MVVGSGWSGWAFGCSGGLVVLGGVEDQLAEQFPGGGVDHADVQVLDEAGRRGFEHGFGRCRGGATGRRRCRVTQPLLSMRSYRTRLWGSASRLAVVGPWGGWRRRSRGWPVRQGPVRPAMVVPVGERVRQGLQLDDGAAGWTGWAASHFLRVCWKRSTLPQVVQGGWGWSSSGSRRGVGVRPPGRCGRPCRRQSGW